MLYLGAHMSIQGGLNRAIDRIQKVKGTALQIFSKNQRQWKIPPLKEEEIETFLKKRKQWGNYPIAIHTSYLVNLASPETSLRKKSVKNLKEEIKRATLLKIEYIITHPGSHRQKGLDKGLVFLKDSLQELLDFASKLAYSGKILLENTCGSGSLLGGNLEELGQVLEGLKFPSNLGCCLDSAHLLAAGYDLSANYLLTRKKIDTSLGLENIYFWHLNDSEYPLGSKRDKHTHIGQGYIGLEGFKNILNDSAFIHLPKVIETPKGKDESLDKENLQRLKELISCKTN